MIPTYSTSYHVPEAGAYGDCFRACIASVLECPMATVPTFFNETNPDAEQVWMEIDYWLIREHGLMTGFLFFTTDNLADLLETLNQTNHNKFYLLLGTSRAGNGHCVVALNDKIVHDPSGGGIVGPIDGHYIVVFLVSAKMKAPDASRIPS